MVFGKVPGLSSPHLSSHATSPTPSHASSANSRSPTTTRSSGFSTASGQPPAAPLAPPPPPVVRANVGLGIGAAGGSSDEDTKAEVSSPLELTEFVDKLLNDLEARFDTMSTDVLSRLSSLSTRVDSLESSIGELMEGSTGLGDAPAPEKGGLLVRSESGRLLGGR